MSTVSDTVLVERSLAGDRSAFGAIVDRYKQVVCATALSVVGDLALSEDVGQEAFVEAWRNLHQLRHPSQLRSWICRIARSRSIDATRKHRRTQPSDGVDPADDRPDPFDALAEKETAALVWAVIERVPESCRAALILYYRNGCSIREVADALGVNESTAKQRLSRGRKHVRAELERLIGRSLESSRPDDRFTAAVIALLPAYGPAAPGALAKSAATSPVGSWALPLAVVTGLGALLAAFVLLQSNGGVAEAGERPDVAASASDDRVPHSQSETTPASSTSTAEGEAASGVPSVDAPVLRTTPGAGSTSDGTPQPFSGSVEAFPGGVVCAHARLWLTEADAGPYPVGRTTTVEAATDRGGRFEIPVVPGRYRLQVTCREARAESGFREVYKTFVVTAPRDSGRVLAVEVPADFQPVEGGEEMPAPIAALFDEDGRPVPREVQRGWRPDLDAADADGDGAVSDEEWRIHDEITSWVLTLDERQNTESEGR